MYIIFLTFFIEGIEWQILYRYSMLKLLAKILKTGTVTEKAPDNKALRDVDFELIGDQAKKLISELYNGRALRIRHVDAGSTNAEELEMISLTSPVYDIERFGISFVASPRHADILTVSGPVTRNMEHALKVAYEMTPNPRIVIAVGDGACTGGVWKGSYAIAGAVEDVIPVDIKIPGSPPSPQVIMNGILGALQKAKEKNS